MPQSKSAYSTGRWSSNAQINSAPFKSCRPSMALIVKWDECRWLDTPTDRSEGRAWTKKPKLLTLKLSEPLMKSWDSKKKVLINMRFMSSGVAQSQSKSVLLCEFDNAMQTKFPVSIRLRQCSSEMWNRNWKLMLGNILTSLFFEISRSFKRCRQFFRQRWSLQEIAHSFSWVKKTLLFK